MTPRRPLALRALALPVLLACAAGVALPGCGGEKLATVTGKVTYKDKPVKGGTVIFTNDDFSKVERTPIDNEGSYKSERVPFGTLKVGVEPIPKPPAAFMPKGAGKKGMPADAPNYSGKSEGEYVDIPANLRDPQKSNITVTIDDQKKQFDIPLK